MVALDYPAAPTTTLLKRDGWNRYHASADTGIAKLTSELEAASQECTTRPIVLIGYSQGALVINRTLVGIDQTDPAVLDQVAAVELVADPQRIGTATYTRGTASSEFNGISISAHFYPADDVPDTLQRRLDSFCAKDDIVCAPDPALLLKLVGNRSLVAVPQAIHGVNVHTHYWPNGTANTAGENAANRLRAFLRSNTRTGPDDLTASSKVDFTQFGPIRFGMTLDEASQVVSVPLVAEFSGGSDTGDPCAAGPGTDLSGVIFLVKDHSIYGVDIQNPAIATTRGIHVGSTESEVRRAYPNARQHLDSTDPSVIFLIAKGTGGRLIGFQLDTNGTDAITDIRAGNRKTVDAYEFCG